MEKVTKILKSYIEQQQDGRNILVVEPESIYKDVRFEFFISVSDDGLREYLHYKQYFSYGRKAYPSVIGVTDYNNNSFPFEIDSFIDVIRENKNKIMR